MGAIITGGTTTGSVDTSSIDDALSNLRREAAVNTADIRRDQENISATIRREQAQDTSDVRREQAVGFAGVDSGVKLATNEQVKETLKAAWKNQDAVKDARYDLNTQGLLNTDRLATQASTNFQTQSLNDYTAARDLAALTSSTNLSFQKIASDISTAQALNAAASALESSKLGTAIALGQAVTNTQIVADGNATRALINELKYAELNRQLVERNAELVEERSEARHWRGHADHWRSTADANQFGAQFAQLQSQMQNFQSQLSSSGQGMNNFGTLSGSVGQTSSANNVR
jgi:hypothetical protein